MWRERVNAIAANRRYTWPLPYLADRQTDSTVLNPVIFPKAEGGHIHLNVVTAL